MDDPIQTYSFIKNIIDKRENEIVGLAVPKGDRLTLAKGKSKYTYLLSLLLIMGPYYFTKNALRTMAFKIKRKLSKYNLITDPSIISYAEKKGVATKRIKSPNNKNFKEYLRSLDIDIIINQSQNFLKQELLDIPKIGVLNRHNAILPKNRGRLTPFWVMLNQEKETGVSIHFVEESLDSGDIVVQKTYPVTRKDTFNSIVKKNYEIASDALLEALTILESDNYTPIPNNDDEATYNSTPSFKEAVRYRKMILKRMI